MAEPEETQAEREREEYIRVRTGGGVTKRSIGLGKGLSDMESKEGGEEGEQEVLSQRSFQRQVVQSRRNTAEVVIVRLARRTQGKEGLGKVSRSFC